MNRKVELLSPVGSWNALIAAVQNGADAVYLGSKLFNARRLANNFNPSELKKAVQYAHLHNVKVYLTLNTLIKNQEIPILLNQISEAYRFGIDAVIMQDLSFAKLIKEHCPNMEVHASTQATLMNSESVKFWQQYVDVFVLARELTKKQVRQIYDKTKAKLEVFVHGHLCISYSGQCLISSLIGKRRGNRGMCASSCPRQYNGDEYLLSAKDLCMIETIPDVIQSGASTIKMEGRMKSSEYVATVTREYRKQLDAALSGKKLKVTKECIDDLKLAFNRNFTNGYFAGEKNIVDPILSSKRGLYLGQVRQGYLRLEENVDLFDGILCVNYGEREGDFVKKIFNLSGDNLNVAKKGELVKFLVPGFKNGAKIYLLSRHGGRNLLGNNQKLAIEIGVDVVIGKKPIIKIIIDESNLTFELDYLAVQAKKNPLTKEGWESELLKWQSDIFSLDIGNIEVETDGSFVPKSLITEFRKKLDQQLLDLLVPIKSLKQSIPTPSYSEARNEKKTDLHVQVYSKQEAIEAINAGCDYLYLDLFDANIKELFVELRSIAKDNQKICAYTAMVLHDADVDKIKKLVMEIKPDSLLVQNVGVLNLKLDVPIILGYQMNVFNDHQLSSYLNHLDSTVSRAVASIELNVNELDKFARKNKLLYYAHGRPIVMTFNERVAKNRLVDNKDYSFPLRRGPTGSSQMLYSKTIGLLQHSPEILKLGLSGLFLDLEKGSDVKGLVALYRSFIEGRTPNVTKFKRGVTVGNFEKGVM